MRLRLTVERQGLPPEHLLWTTSSFVSTSNPPPSSSSLSLSTSAPSRYAAASLTVAQLLDQINAVIPLESPDWGLEDYILELAGYECLHFAKVEDILKEDDAVTVRPLQTQDVRLRALAGRVQVSRDGRHLYDGVGWGKPFIRRAPRPDIRIMPRRDPMPLFRKDEDEEEEQMALPQPPRQGYGQMSGPPLGLGLQEGQPDDYYTAYSHNPELEAQDSHEPLALVNQTHLAPHTFTQTTGARPGSLRPRKRRLESPFQPAGEAKRAKSAQYAFNGYHQIPSGITPTISKSVRFDDSQHTPRQEEMETPATIYDMPVGTSSEDGDSDYAPDTDGDSEFDEADKENFDPTSPPAARQAPPPSSDPSNQATIVVTTSPSASREPLAEVDTSSVTPSDSDLEDEAWPEKGFDHTKTNPESDSNFSSSSDATGETSSSNSDSEDDSDSSSDSETSETSELSTEEKNEGVKNPKRLTSDLDPVPPRHGKKTTHRRNVRKSMSNRLAKLKREGVLPEDATFRDLKAYASGNEPASRVDDSQDNEDFSSRRQRLLEAITAGGVDVTEFQISKQKRVSQAPFVNGHSEVDAGFTSTTPGSDVRNAEISTSKDDKTPTPSKRRRLDVDSSTRILLNGLGLRVPKTKADKDALQKESLSRAQQEAGKHQRQVEKQMEEASSADKPGITIDDNWRDHVLLRAVECMDPNIQYSTPPFPFKQRWDPEQSASLWRQPNRKRKKGNSKRCSEINMEEYYDASMYDDQPQSNTDEVNQTLQPLPVDDKHGEASKVIDVTEKPDLTLETAALGAKIAFKHLELSEKTNWTPIMSDYKVATVLSREGSSLTLQLDREFVPAKEIDPETGERIFSNFRIEAMEVDSDDSIIDLSFDQLSTPKLVQPADASNTGENGKSSQPTAQSHVHEDVVRSGSIPDASFGASTHTLVEDLGEGSSFRQNAPEMNASGHDSRREVSVLIREAGFRTSVDPEARRPLNRSGNSVAIGENDEAVLEQPTNAEETEFDGFSSSNGNEQSEKQNDSGSVDKNHGHQINSIDLIAKEDHDDYTNEIARKAVVQTDEERSKHSEQSSIENEGDDNDPQYRMAGARHRDSAPFETPRKELKQVAANDQSSPQPSENAPPFDEQPDSQSSLPELDVLIASSQQSKGHTQSPLGQAEPAQTPKRTGQRATRLNTRRASAMANPITLSDDEPGIEGSHQSASSPLLPSTAPASFRAINAVESFREKDASRAEMNGNGPGLDGAIDLTAVSDRESSSSDGDDLIEHERAKRNRASKHAQTGKRNARRTSTTAVNGRSKR